MIGSVVKALVDALKSSTTGINAHIAALTPAHTVRLPTIPASHIYGVDSPVNIATLNVPALVVTPTGTDTEQVRSQAIRDSVHKIGFEYAALDVDTDDWRLEAMYVAEALMRFLDNFNTNNPTYVGTCGAIVVMGWTVDYTVTWQVTPNAIRGFALEAQVYARDSF